VDSIRVFFLYPYPSAVKISVDGGRPRDYGPDLIKLKLAPGPHTVLITSRYCYPRKIRIKPEDRARTLRPRLKWRGAFLKVVSNVPADVQAGRTIGRTSSRVRIKVPQTSLDGTLKILVKVYAAQYHTVRKTVELRAGTTRTLRVTLRPF